MSERPPADDETTRADEPELDEREERAVEELLRQAERPPELSAEARDRIGQVLQRAAQEAGGDADTAAPRPKPSRSVVGGMVVALWRRRRPISTAASALALAAAAALVIYWMQGTSTVVHANDGVGPLAVELEDGTRAILDSGAEIVGESRRELRLVRGRVLLDVSPADRPLVVASPHGRIVALGTRMMVEAGGEMTRAAVVRGRVRLEGAAGSELLHAGDEGTLGDDGAPSRGRARRLSYLTSWAREAMDHRAELVDEPIRRGTLVARAPGWDREWPLPVRELKVDVHVADGVVRTTIDQTFFNRVNRRLEGQYSFPLPPDAAVSRLAMYVEGELVEGGIVERQRGREIYESIVYLRRDPALLEWMAGNTFRVRIFPLEARQEKRIILSYTQPLERLYDSYRVAVPIPELDGAVGRVAFDVRVAGGAYRIEPRSHAMEVTSEGPDRVARFRADDHVVGHDLVVALRDEAAAADEARRYVHGEHELLLARIMPQLDDQPVAHRQRKWALLVDTSASRSALELRAQAHVARRLIAEMDEQDRVVMLAFDSSVRPWTAGWLPAEDVDRATIQQFVARHLDEPLGDTDLEAGLKSALRWLGKEEAGADAQPTIVLLADGIATGGQREGERLTELVAGKAEVIGIALGDRVDASVLGSLADATGGRYVQWQPQEDLSWKVFDLVASLHTPRLGSLAARLVDGQGRVVEDATAYLASRQLAAGEAATVVARWPRSTAPTALVLTGSLAGRRWTHELALPAPTSSARYLPRLFARRHIEALTRDGVAKHRDEITALGLEHFLVTPLTSLLVLETEAMYRQFEVSRPRDDRFAPYDAPAKIPVKTEPLGNEPLSTGAEGQSLILRTPVSLIERPAPGGGWLGNQAVSWEGDFGMLGLSGIGTIGAGPRLPRRASRVRMGFSGQAFGGGGTGVGFGSGHGRLGRGPMKAPAPDTRPTIVTTGALRSSTESVDWVGKSLASRREEVADDVAAAIPTAAASVWESAGPAPTRGFRTAEPSTRAGSLGAADEGWKVPTGLLGAPIGHVAHEVSTPGPIDARLSRQPVAFFHSSDPRLDDLTEFVPALFGDALDADYDALAAERAAGKRGSLSVAARELLARAVEAQRPARYHLEPEGAAAETLTVDAGTGGAFRIVQRAATGLGEQLVFDGDELTALYPELRLAVSRPVGLCAPAMLARLAPMQLPASSVLERSYDVSVVDERTIRMTPLGAAGERTPGVETVDVTLDSGHRIVKVRRARPGRAPVVTELEWAGDRLSVIVRGDDRFRVRPEALDEGRFDGAVPSGWVKVRLPLRDPSYEQARRAETKPGSEPWRSAQQQLLATQAALGNTQALWRTLQELQEHAGPVRRAELVLASRAARLVPSEEELARLLEGLDDDDAVADFVRAAWKARHPSGSERPFAAVSKSREGGLIGMLAAYRALLEAIDDGKRKSAFERYGELAQAGGYPPLRFAALQRLTSRWRWDHAATLVELWEGLSDDRNLGVLALLAAAEVAQSRAHDPELGVDPAGLLTRAFERAAERQRYPICDHWVRQTFLQSAGGQARWRLFWTRWRAELLAAENLGALLALGQSMLALDLRDEYGLLAVKARAQPVADATEASQLALLLLRMERAADARSLLEPHLPSDRAELSAADGALLRLASAVAEREGKLSLAATYLDRSTDARTETMPLAQARGIYRRLFDLRLRAWRAEGDDAGLDGALAVARRWRRLDPDHGEIDQLCATVLYTEGEPERARRHLASIIDRHPAEGDAFAEVAEVLEAQGRLDEAAEIWRRAFAVEPTNPTWLLRQAQASIALGKYEAARPLLDRIESGSWQDRFDDVPRQARELERWTKKR
ncbi:MAG: FecR domain-containing protein [Deltaproteobacteria bacterium]|jgi:ferric-dicitrate binding protein FerR (iron transport regulator)/tetratricopeptide (TPR) repeat protein|nr:FecR domain-containing protein [Deltaproteobacteria bacterium]MBW2531887.1 FecR domain-containing protein [Deltaproteobacteria bacterium]